MSRNPLDSSFEALAYRVAFSVLVEHTLIAVFVLHTVLSHSFDGARGASNCVADSLHLVGSCTSCFILSNAGLGHIDIWICF